jgi:hypothetical protein
MSDTREFINQIIAGDNVSAKETLENILSAKSFEVLDNYKKEIAQGMFDGNQEVETEEETESEE